MTERLPDGLRADAQHNRDRILAVARDALATAGDISLNSIAKKAGVGAGTLYRHFPTREDLVLTIYGAELQDVALRADTLLADTQLEDRPPLDALRGWLGRLKDLAAARPGLADALHSADGNAASHASYSPLLAALARLLLAAEKNGDIPPGHRPADIMLLMDFLWRPERGADGADGADGVARSGRLLDLVVTGLQAGAPGRADQASPVRSRRRRNSARRLAVLALFRTRR